MTALTTLSKIRGIIRRASDGMMQLLAILVLAMMLAIAVQVVASRLGVNSIVSWQNSVFLFDRAITLNSLIELHWYFLSAIILLPIATIWADDAHVRVDFIYSALSSRAQAAIELIGHFLFTLPFLIMCIPAAWNMTLVAYSRGERSQDDGLLERFLVKGMIPLAFGILLILIAVQLPSLIRRLLSRRNPS